MGAEESEKVSSVKDARVIQRAVGWSVMWAVLRRELRWWRWHCRIRAKVLWPFQSSSSG